MDEFLQVERERGVGQSQLFGDRTCCQAIGRLLPPPALHGQFIADLDSFSHVPGGLRFSYRVYFCTGEADAQPVRVTQTFTAIAAEGSRSGFRRRIEITGVPAGWWARLEQEVNHAPH